MSDMHFDFSGFAFSVSGLPSAFERRLSDDWRAFSVEPGAEAAVSIVVACESTATHDAAAPFSPKLMRSELDGESARYTLPEGRAFVEADAPASITLMGQQDSRLYFAMMNLLRATIAWSLPRHGMLMLHAAGLRLGDRAFVLVGSEGCGKSTWVRCGIEGGAQPISDDIVLVDTRAGSAVAMGSPFRSTQQSDYRIGRWEIDAFLLPDWGGEAALRKASELETHVALVSNLPFVAEALSRPSIAAALDRLVAQRWRRLTFAPSPSFVPLLRDRGREDG